MAPTLQLGHVQAFCNYVNKLWIYIKSIYFSGQPGAGGPLPDLRAFPAIPEAARNAPLPIGADPAGFGIFETVNLG